MSSGTSRSTVFRSVGSLGGGGLLTLMGYLVGLMVALCCGACRVSSPGEFDVNAAQPESLAGPGHTEIPKAAGRSSDVGAATERSAIGPTPTGPWSSHLEYCDLGFKPGDDANVDLVRLGALCGRSNGLVEVSSFAPRTDAVGSSEEPWSAPLRGKREATTCGRLAIGLVDAGGGAIAVELRGGAGHEVLAECQLSKSGFCPARSLVCDASELRVSHAPRALHRGSTGYELRMGAGDGVTVRLAWWAFPAPAVAAPPRSSAP